MSSSKRRQSPYGEAVSQGRCCTNSACSRRGRQSFETLLQSDVFPPPCEGNRRKTESSQELRTDVGSAAAAQHTHIHVNTHAQVAEHHGEDNYERPAETSNLSTALNDLINKSNMEGAALGARTTNDGEEGEVVGETEASAQGEDEPEQRLCGGCQKPKARTGFATREWEKSRRLVQGGGEEMQGVRTSRRAAVNGRRWAEQPAQEKGSSEKHNRRKQGGLLREV